MADPQPLVSVTMPAYNNARHIADAIESVLAQTVDDLELVIVDDGSVDDTLTIVRRFDDRRIVVEAGAHRGAAAATNTAIQVARGRYIALFAADDICHPRRLERELAHLDETGRRIVFSWADFIDENGQPLTGEHFAANHFNHPARTQAEMLAWFFFRGNYLCTVSCLAERQLFLDAGLFPATSAQLPDFAMWLRLVTHHELGLLPERLVAYRVHHDGSNASAPANARRAYFEMCQIYRNLFADCPVDLFRSAFAGRLRQPDFSDGHEYELAQSFLYLEHDIPAIRALGLERLYLQLQDPACLAAAEGRFGFGVPQLLELTNSFDATTASEFLDMRSWALRLDREYTTLLADWESLRAHSAVLQTHCDAIVADRQKLQIAYDALLETLGNTQAEYQKLDAYARHVLAVKDELEAELQSVARTGGAGGN